MFAKDPLSISAQSLASHTVTSSIYIPQPSVLVQLLLVDQPYPTSRFNRCGSLQSRIDGHLISNARLESARDSAVVECHIAYPTLEPETPDCFGCRELQAC